MVIKLTLKKPSGALPKKSCKHVGFYTEVEENDFSPTKAVKSFKDADFTEKKEWENEKLQHEQTSCKNLTKRMSTFQYSYPLANG